MCETGPHFKLCTCDISDLCINHWELVRGSTFGEAMAVGSFLPPLDVGEAQPISEASFFLDRLLFDLNNVDVFDFDYSPKEGDLLNVFFFDENLDEEFDRKIVASIEYLDGKFNFCTLDRLLSDGGETLASGEILYVPKP